MEPLSLVLDLAIALDSVLFFVIRILAQSSLFIQENL